MVEKRKVTMYMFNFLVLAIMAVTGAYFISTTPTSTQSQAYFEVLGTQVDGFPDVPLYPGSVITASNKKAERGMVGYETDLTTPDRASHVLLWYRQNLKLEGWEEVAPPDFPSSERSHFAQYRKDNQHFNLTIEREEKDATEILIEFPLQSP